MNIVGPGNVNDHGVNLNVDGGNISDQNYNAEYGQAGNTIVNVVTKSGTNAFHGDAHAYFRGRNLGASSYFYNLTNPPDRAPFFKHEYGFTAGGPLVKNRFFVFREPGRCTPGIAGNVVAVRFAGHSQSTRGRVILVWQSRRQVNG